MAPNKLLLKTGLLCALLLFSMWASANIELPSLLSDGAIIQRDKPVPIWGKANPNSKISVTLGDTTKQVTSDAEGDWAVVFDACVAGSKLVLTVTDGQQRLVVQDLLAGDIWVASGQSNMEWVLRNTIDADEEIHSANYPAIRHFKVQRTWAAQASDSLASGQWQPAGSAYVGEFSAVAYYFAKKIHLETGIPIGIINSNWGGSSIESWMSPAALHKTPEETRDFIQQLISDGKRNTQALKMSLQRWPGSVVDTLTTADADWSAEKIDMQDWLPIATPILWEDQGYPGVDGVMWYRKIITLNADEAASDIELGLGRIDDNDITWVNGQQVGSTQAYDVARVYHVAGKFLKPGENTIAIRVEDTGGGGGIYSDENLLYLQTAGGARRSLAGNWNIKADRITVSEIDEVNHVETALYNKMLYPLFKTPIKGVIWYQGEANANTLAQAENYAQQFPALIQDWRGGWQDMTLPFYWVQLANFDSGSNTGDEKPWAVLRESQTAALELANTGQAITIDVGNPQDIHPRDKLTVGNRLALIALNKTYGYSKLHYRGPVFKSVVRKKDRIMVKFSTDKHLRTKAGEHTVTGFEVAANDGVYKAVTGKIKGNSVVIPTKDPGSATFLRYAWNDNPEDAGLFDDTGLPAEPFRTAIPD